MKQSKLILVTILAGIFLLLGGVLIWGIYGSGLGRSNQSIQVNEEGGLTNYTKVLELEVPAEQIETLNLFYDKNSNDIYFYESDSDQIIIEEYANKELSEKEKTKVTEANGMLTLDSPKRNSGIVFLGINNKHGYVNVYLPASYQGDLNVSALSGEIESQIDLMLGKDVDFAASSTSGDISLLKVEAQNADISSVSGELSIVSIAADTDVSTTSGDVDISTCEGNCNVSTVSGCVEINSIAGEMDINTTSGDIIAEGILGGGDASTVSGDIRFLFTGLNKDVDISTTSGEVSVYLPENSALNFEGSTTSGDIQTFFDDSLSFNKKGNHASGVYGNGEKVNLGIGTTSGDIVIRKN